MRDVSFTLERGSSLGLVGESGSGKTTLLRLLLGLIRPSAGAIRFEDVLIATDMEVTAAGGFTMTDGSEQVIATGLPPVFDPLTMR